MVCMRLSSSAPDCAEHRKPHTVVHRTTSKYRTLPYGYRDEIIKPFTVVFTVRFAVVLRYRTVEIAEARVKQVFLVIQNQSSIFRTKIEIIKCALIYKMRRLGRSKWWARIGHSSVLLLRCVMLCMRCGGLHRIRVLKMSANFAVVFLILVLNLKDWFWLKNVVSDTENEEK